MNCPKCGEEMVNNSFNFESAVGLYFCHTCGIEIVVIDKKV